MCQKHQTGVFEPNSGEADRKIHRSIAKKTQISLNTACNSELLRPKKKKEKSRITNIAITGMMALDCTRKGRITSCRWNESGRNNQHVGEKNKYRKYKVKQETWGLKLQNNTWNDKNGNNDTRKKRAKTARKQWQKKQDWINDSDSAGLRNTFMDSRPLLAISTWLHVNYVQRSP